MLLMDFHLAHEAQIELWSKYNFSALCPFHVSFRFMFLLTFRMPGAIRSNCLATKLPVLTDSKSPAIPYPTLSLSLLKFTKRDNRTGGKAERRLGLAYLSHLIFPLIAPLHTPSVLTHFHGHWKLNMVHAVLVCLLYPPIRNLNRLFLLETSVENCIK